MLDFIISSYNMLVKFFLLAIVFVIGFNYKKYYSISSINYILLYVFHFSIAFFSWYLSSVSNNDAQYYFLNAEKATSWSSLFGFSSKAINFISYPFVNYLKFDFQLLFLVFSVVAFFGFLLLNKAAKRMLDGMKMKVLGIEFINIMIFLPSFHLWVSPIGKDSLIFFLQMWLLNLFFNFKKNKFKIFFIFLMVLFIRPYLIAYWLAAYLLAVFLTKKKMIIKAFLYSILAILVFIIVKFYFQFDVFEYLSNRIKFISRYVDYRSDTGFFIDPLDYNLIHKMFIYIFGPTIFSASGFFQQFIALENILLISIFIYGLFQFKFKNIKSNMLIIVMCVYVMISWLIGSYMLYNLGISNRQKFLIIPFMFILMIYFYKQKILNKKA